MKEKNRKTNSIKSMNIQVQILSHISNVNIYLGRQKFNKLYEFKPATNPEKKKLTQAKVRVWSTRKLYVIL